ncbi:MAG: isoprenylcysteine carboxylmethyltransferase family protein [Thermoguttaceae bacterium]|nr:isoprenylcysteine carboxylmethyltransferase family protein [Thermoguttaceae bacterium]
MPMIEEMEKQGAWFFRWRSYLPLFLFLVAIPAYLQFHYESELCDHIWEITCLGCGFLGLGIRAITIGYVPAGTSGRNTHGQVAEQLNTTGIYSLVRNPLYLGNYFMWLAPVMFLQTWWLVLICSLVFFIYYERIIFVEEQFLREKFGDAYVTWASRTPMFFPKLRGWIQPAESFSWKTVIRREYHGFYALIVTLFALEIATDLWVEKASFGIQSFDLSWIIGFGLSTIFYLVVRIICKKTQWLRVEGRP